MLYETPNLEVVQRLVKLNRGTPCPTRAPGEAVGVYPFMPDYNSVDRYRRFATDLQKRGWSEARLEKLMGGNFLRVYRGAWGG